MATQEEAILLKAFDLIGEGGWKTFSIQGLADASSVPLAEVQALLPSSIDVPLGLFKRADDHMKRVVGTMSLSAAARENLCEFVLLRLEYLAPYKKGLAAIHRDMLCAPSLMAALLPPLQDNLGWLLTTAGFSYDPLTFFFARQALGVVLFQTQQVWFADETPDLSATLSFLDRKLTLYEEIISNV